jgi:hypothetical protein
MAKMRYSCWLERRMKRREGMRLEKQQQATRG